MQRDQRIDPPREIIVRSALAHAARTHTAAHRNDVVRESPCIAKSQHCASVKFEIIRASVTLPSLPADGPTRSSRSVARNVRNARTERGDRTHMRIARQ